MAAKEYTHAKTGRKFTIEAHPIGNFFVCIISEKGMVAKVLTEHITPGTGPIGAEQVAYFGSPEAVWKAGEDDINAWLLKA